MATYDERVVYDWSSPTQLNDWDIQYSGPAGSVAITDGKLVLAPNRSAVSGVNLISKAIGFDALEMDFNTGRLGSGLTRYLTLSFGTGGVCDDAGKVPGTDFWHQGMANSVTLHLQDPGANANGSFVRDYANGGRIERGYYPLPQGTDLTKQNRVLIVFKPGEYQVWLNSTQILSIPTVTTKSPTKVMIHQGWYAPGVWGADTTISQVTLYRGYDHFGELTIMGHPMKCVPANQEPRSVFQPQDVAWRGTPPLYPGPVKLQQQTQYPLCKGRDYFWIRDGVQNFLQGYIESTVTISGVGVRRRVLCFTQDGELVGETYSRASDGVYRFDLLWLNKRYMLVAQDDPAFGYADYNAVAADYQAPKPYPPGGGVAAAPFPMLAPLKRN
ncbi:MULTISPECIES: hypothetical protein [unclassified Aeromonas]|uniref:hypothetical protein n=1 Tax=unclassified Aeromonas TaxID=257493 RepID=UPI000AE07ECA|nr:MULTISPECIES: hypothetical protein [unclassified Aeromonas]